MSRNVKHVWCRLAMMLITMGTLALGVVVSLRPDLAQHVVEEVVCGIGCGLILTGVRIIDLELRVSFAVRSVSWWASFWVCLLVKETKTGLLGGYLLGIMLALASLVR